MVVDLYQAGTLEAHTASSMKVPRVAQLTFSGGFGGREKVAFSLTQALAEHAAVHSVLYLVVEKRGDDGKIDAMLKILEQYKVRSRIFETDSRFSLALLKDIGRALVEDGINVLHAHCYKSAAYAAMLKVGAPSGLATTFTLHGIIIPLSLNFFFIHAVNNLSILMMDGVVGCSREIVSLYQKLPLVRDKVEVIPNCLLGGPPALAARPGREESRRALADRYGLDIEAVWIGKVGRLTPQKNYPLFLRAMRALSDGAAPGLKVQALVVGDGELNDELRALAVELGVVDKVTFTGFVTDMAQVYEALDIVGVTSDWEGTPMCVLEAMSHGLPVVASEVGGNGDLVEHGRTGYLFPKGDQAGLVAHLSELVRRSDLREQAGKAACRRVADEFTPGLWVDRHLAHYRTLVAAQDRRAARR